MALARDVAELEQRIRGRVDVDLFSPIAKSGLLEVAEVGTVLGRLEGIEALPALRLCLQALRIQYTELVPRLIDAELVATLPPEVPGLARPTEAVVHEMISKSQSEIIVLGYEFTDLTLVQLLAQASARDVAVIVICDRSRGGAGRIHRLWPTDCSRPRVFQDCPRQGSAPYASMHAKCLLVDARQLLVTSANFTFHGLHGNIEIGVRIGGAPAAEARKVFSHLVENKIVEIVEEISG